MQAKEKISDATRTSSEEGFFNPLEQVNFRTVFPTNQSDSSHLPTRNIMIQNLHTFTFHIEISNKKKQKMIRLLQNSIRYCWKKPINRIKWNEIE